jgi:tetratricopeptide (TPR) repeat protein
MLQLALAGSLVTTKPLLARFIESQANTSASLIAAVSTLGELERQSGNFEVSIGYDLQAIKLDPQNDSQIHIMANTYNNSGGAEKAIQIYLAGIEVMPTNAFFDRNLGRILEQQGQVEKALVAYEAALEKEPESEFYKTLVDDTRQRLQR